MSENDISTKLHKFTYNLLFLQNNILFSGEHRISVY